MTIKMIDTTYKEKEAREAAQYWNEEQAREQERERIN